MKKSKISVITSVNTNMGEGIGDGVKQASEY